MHYGFYQLSSLGWWCRHVNNNARNSQTNAGARPRHGARAAARQRAGGTPEAWSLRSSGPHHALVLVPMCRCSTLRAYVISARPTRVEFAKDFAVSCNLEWMAGASRVNRHERRMCLTAAGGHKGESDGQRRAQVRDKLSPLRLGHHVPAVARLERRVLLGGIEALHLWLLLAGLRRTANLFTRRRPERAQQVTGCWYRATVRHTGCVM